MAAEGGTGLLTTCRRYRMYKLGKIGLGPNLADLHSAKQVQEQLPGDRPGGLLIADRGPCKGNADNPTPIDPYRNWHSRPIRMQGLAFLPLADWSVGPRAQARKTKGRRADCRAHRWWGERCRALVLFRDLFSTFCRETIEIILVVASEIQNTACTSLCCMRPTPDLQALIMKFPDDAELKKEWKTLPHHPSPRCGGARKYFFSALNNPGKNRYPDVLPFERTLVRLHTGDHCSYINANFIQTVPQQRPRYIACQAPLPHTFTDFWVMVWVRSCCFAVPNTVLTILLGEQHTSDCHAHQAHGETPSEGTLLLAWP